MDVAALRRQNGSLPPGERFRLRQARKSALRLPLPSQTVSLLQLLPQHLKGMEGKQARIPFLRMVLDNHIQEVGIREANQQVSHPLEEADTLEAILQAEPNLEALQDHSREGDSQEAIQQEPGPTR